MGLLTDLIVQDISSVEKEGRRVALLVLADDLVIERAGYLEERVGEIVR